MRDSLMVRGLAGVVVGFTLLVSSVSSAGTAWSLHDALALEDAPSGLALRLGTTGIGPWRLEVVRIPVGAEFIELEVAPLPPGVDTGDHHPLLTAGFPDVDAARFAEVAPNATPRNAYAGLAVVLLLAGLWAMWLGLRPLGLTVFGHRDPDSRDVTFVPGGGTHGTTGGQVPPYVPYNRDWDPKNRIE